MEPVTGTVYLVLFVAVVSIRHGEHKRPDKRERYEDLKDRLYMASLGFEGFVSVILALLLH